MKSFILALYAILLWIFSAEARKQHSDRRALARSLRTLGRHTLATARTMDIYNDCLNNCEAKFPLKPVVGGLMSPPERNNCKSDCKSKYGPKDNSGCSVM